MASDKGERLMQEFLAIYGGDAAGVRTFFAPGRVNLIGEHTDYNGGHVLPAAISLGISAAVRYTSDRTVRFRSTDLPGGVSQDLDSEVRPDRRNSWANYPLGVLSFLLQETPDIQGCQALYSGDLPVGAGLSSSAALEVLTAYLLLYPQRGDEIDRIRLAKVCQAAENRFVGVGCGIMDQFSVSMGRKDNAILLDCASLDYRYIPCRLGEFRLLILDTGKRRSLGDSMFNRRRAECGAALEAVRRFKEVPNLCAATLQDVDAYVADETLNRRARHVVSENLRTLKAAELLAQGDLQGFGRLLVESHNSLQYNYEVTGPELDIIVEEALAVGGCLGARMTGGGFAGCAVALVRAWETLEFADRVSSGYRKRTRLVPSIYECAIGDGVRAGIPELPASR